MRRRITSAIMSVAGLIVLTLGIPLAIVAHRSIVRSEVVRVQSTVARSLAEITTPIDVTQLDAIATERDAPPPFSVYAPDGTRLYGTGPLQADAAVIAALRGTASTVTEGAIVIASPITDSADEKLVGVLRISRSLDDVNARTRRDWLVMAAAALVVLGGGWIVANRLARRLAEPAGVLAEVATSLGHGGVIERPATTGIPELDALGGALWDSSQRINEALGRERQFSADVSHQLRTPLTGLRLTLESSRDVADPRPAVAASLAELDRIEATVSHLLQFARDAIPSTATANLAEAVDQSAARWVGRVASASRTLVHSAPPPVIVQASAASIDQILDVLVDNALQHGAGTITVSPRPISGGVAVDVSDEGSGIITVDRDRIFQRGEGSHHGIGLALARSIAEAEGGRLILHGTSPTTFSLILLTQERN